MTKRNQPILFLILNGTIERLYLREGLRPCGALLTAGRKRRPKARPQFSLGSRPISLNNPFGSLNNCATFLYSLPYPVVAELQNS